jgi:hypothetical protein
VLRSSHDVDIVAGLGHLTHKGSFAEGEETLPPDARHGSFSDHDED